MRNLVGTYPNLQVKLKGFKLIWIEEDKIMPLPEAWVASVLSVQCDLQVIIQRDSAQTFPIHSQDFCSWFSTVLHMNVWSNISSSTAG